MNSKMEDFASVIMCALSSLSPTHLSHLSQSVAGATHRHHLRLSSVLSSPTLFSLSLRYLHSLSLSQKTLLLARHLLSSLHLLTRHLHHLPYSHAPPLSHRDLDAALLLLFFCETHQHNPQALVATSSHWRRNLRVLFSQKLFTLCYSGVGACALIPYVEMVSRSMRLVGAMGCGKEKKESPASAAAVVGLPAVEMKESGRECVICKEEMRVGRDVCELPCHHMFHWMCVLPWLSKSNTCPCCRFRLPSDNVYAEIQRLLDLLLQLSPTLTDFIMAKT